MLHAIPVEATRSIARRVPGTARTRQISELYPSQHEASDAQSLLNKAVFTTRVRVSHLPQDMQRYRDRASTGGCRGAHPLRGAAEL